MSYRKQSKIEQPWVPVVSSTGKPLMPCHPARARKLITKGRAESKRLKDFYYIRLLDREDGEVQDICVGIDPGSKREGYTVLSEHRTLLNVQTHAAPGNLIKKSMEGRSDARRARRNRNTPCRAPKFLNRSRKNFLPPSTKARWQRKLNMVKFFSRLYPVTKVAVEDVNTEAKKGSYFNPVMMGKNWLYRHLENLGLGVTKYRGNQTASYRRRLGLYKTDKKLTSGFNAHCVDSWVIANETLGKRTYVDLKQVVELIHHKFTRRQLHRFNYSKGGIRRRYGGTMSLGVQKGTLCHYKGKLGYIGGNTDKGRFSIHSSMTGIRVTQITKLEDMKLLSYLPWRVIRHGVSVFSRSTKRVTRLNRLALKLAKVGITNSRVFRQLREGPLPHS